MTEAFTFSIRLNNHHQPEECVEYVASALSPLILERLSLTHEDFAIIERAATDERDMDKTCSLVGGAKEVIQRLEPLVAGGARHLSFGPSLGPDPLEAVEIPGGGVLPYFIERRT